MMGIGSLFGLSRGLSVLVEFVRMLNVGKKGKPAERWLGSPSSLWRLHAAKRRQRCWGAFGFRQLDELQWA
jgi:hypothetical protein